MSMKLFRHWDALPTEVCGSVVALGNFDGVHCGHRAVIATAQRIAAESGGLPAVLTFEPHPRAVFRPQEPPFRLTPLRVKARLLEAQGVAALFVLHFDSGFWHKSAENFVRDVLVAGLRVRHVVAGYDFLFGHRRTGDVHRLVRMGAELGFAVTEVGPVADPCGGVFSSTRVREALLAGRPEEATRLLGHPWEIEGRVETGDRIGRTLGFPTANFGFGDYLRPAFGVYAVRAGVDAGAETTWYQGVANLGHRPTVAGPSERVEVHLLDFSGDLYGRHLRVQLIQHLRPEQKFPDLAALRAQIVEDCRLSRIILQEFSLFSGKEEV